MLEHKLPFNFLGPPLAALHSMTEMKSSLGGGASVVSGGDSNNNNTSAPSMSSPNAGLTAHTMHGQANAPNPHGIDTILSRPPPVTSAGLSSLTAGAMPRFSIAAAAAGMAQYLQQSQQQHQQNQLKGHGAGGAASIVDRPHLYWPGLQGLVANPMAWRDRLTGTMASGLAHSHHHQQQQQQQHQQHHHDKDGKKKHTRPTFSGQQIFALEKTFEQTKYLAGPERAKLAYALGMSESQVKVWFQNRRTKWRKRHAAEMATAKRKQEELGGDDGDCSEPNEDSDCESLDMSDGGGGGSGSRKRCRVDVEDMGH